MKCEICFYQPNVCNSAIKESEIRNCFTAAQINITIFKINDQNTLATSLILDFWATIEALPLLSSLPFTH